MKRKFLLLKIFFISLTLVILLALFSLLFFRQYTRDRKNEIIIENQRVELEVLEKEIDTWKELYTGLIEIKDEYRVSIKEIIDMLYLKNMPVGGSSITSVTDSDEITIRLARDTINSFKEEKKAITQIKGYLVQRNKFINDFPFIYPIKDTGASTLTSGFGFRQDALLINGPIVFHAGVDLVSFPGSEIIATADGRVEYVDQNHSVYGKLVIIEHNFSLRTYYAHLSDISVKIGDIVKRGQKIGYIGATGPTTGIHLHYEVRLGDIPLDPMNFIGASY